MTWQHSAAAKRLPDQQMQPINGRATQTLPNTGPTGDSRISVKKILSMEIP